MARGGGRRRVASRTTDGTHLERVEAVVQTFADGQRRDRGVESRVYRPRRRRARDAGRAASRSRELAVTTLWSPRSLWSRARAPRRRRRGRARGGRRRHVSARDATPREESTARREVPTRRRPDAFEAWLGAVSDGTRHRVVTADGSGSGKAVSAACQVGFAIRHELSARILTSRDITSSPPSPPPDARLTPSRRHPPSPSRSPPTPRP